MDGIELLEYSENHPEKQIEIKQIGNLAELAVNHLIPIKIEALSTVMERVQDVEIVDDNGTHIGYLCAVKADTGVLIESMTDPQFACFLIEVTIEEMTADIDEYRFKNDYAVIHSDRIDEYNENFKNSSTLWGHYTHTRSHTPIKRSAPKLTAFKSFNISQHHQEGLARACEASNSFERFLKLYHQLELLFDFIFVATIKNLNGDLKGFSEVMKNYSREESATLKSLISKFLSNPTRLEPIFLKANSHESLFKTIFQDHGKESNPLKDDNRFTAFWNQIAAGSITHADLKRSFGKLIFKAIGVPNVARDSVNQMVLYR